MFFQAGAEELLFRGYLTQQLALRASNPIVWAVLPSLLFGALHYDPTLPGNAGLYYVAAASFLGMTLTMMVVRTGGLAASIGFHAAYNSILLVAAGTEGFLDGALLFATRNDDVESGLIAGVIANAAVFALVVSPLSPFPKGRTR